MTPPNKSRPYILGLSVGTFWLVAASTGFAILSIAMSGTGSGRMVILAIGIAAAVLLGSSVLQIRAAVKLPAEPRVPRDRRPGRQFALVVFLEVAGIGIVNTMNYFYGNPSLFVPLDLIVVGIHFLPLARLFGVPRYTTLGLMFCIISGVTLLLISSDANVGAANARFLVSTLGCAASGWVISISSQIEIRRLLQEAAGSRGRL